MGTNMGKTVLILSMLTFLAPITRAAEACGSTLPAIAVCNHRLAVSDNAVRHTAQAEVHYLRALAAWEQTSGMYLQPWCISLMDLGQLYRQQRRVPEAEKLLLQALDMARRIEAQSPETYPEALSRLGGLYGESDQPERGRPLLTEAIGRLGKLGPDQTAELASAYNSLGMIDLAAGHLSAGESNLHRAVDLAASSLGEDHLETATWQINLALALVLEGQFERAEPLLRRARFLVETRAVNGAGESDPRLAPDPRLATILAEFSAAAAGENKLALAEDYAQQELSVLTRQPAPDAIAIALAQVNLGTIYIREGKIDEAERILPAAVAAERRIAAGERILADGIQRLAALRAIEQSWREAEALYREAIGIYESRLGPDNPQLAPVLRAYAGVLKRAGGSKSEAKSLESRAKSIINSAPRA
jgi:tetratricopeptide (TPR) repeat protein